MINVFFAIPVCYEIYVVSEEYLANLTCIDTSSAVFRVCIDFWLQKQDGAKKEITILDTKRSNAINIGLTALPKPDAIKTAIMKLDSSVINREGIEVCLLAC